MMRLPRFRYHSPKNISDSAHMISDLGPDAMVVAGGTDLFPNMKRRQFTPGHVIGLRNVRELHGISASATGELRIGAMTTLTAIERDEAINRSWPALAHAARVVSTPPLRNMGTLGGNICLDTRCNYWNQSFEWRKSVDFCLKRDGDTCWVAPGSDRCWAVSSSDTAPLLCAVGAEITLVSKAGERRIPITRLFADDGIEHLAKARDELVSAIHVPPSENWRAVYVKVRRRGSFDFPVLGIAAAVRLERAIVTDARIFIGGAGSHPHDAAAAAQLLVGKPLGADAIAEAAARAGRVAKPLDNTDFELGWRKEMARVHVSRALSKLYDAGP
jgi:4-hydroxybenzoyl-CoA reductase subunit beta